ncbi:MAG: argininosuccinate lyase [Fusobacteriaceae bacterium]
MQYFSGRFKEKAKDLLLNFHSSITFDARLYKYDIMGSVAHVKGLAKQKIISGDEAKLIEKTLLEILDEIESDKIEFSIEYEDIHMNIEKILIDRIGDVGKKLHTGRSRNDQVAVDMKLFMKDEIQSVNSLLLNLLETINSHAKNNLETYMPGFTHLQKAQPITFSHYILAYAEMFRRDFLRLQNNYNLMDTCPLGSAALAGTTYDLDRDYVAKLLGFKSASLNSMDSVSDRDYLIEFLNCSSIIMMHLSRLCEELIIFSSSDFSYIEISDGFSTGSSIMPQKKNPDAAELIRGKSGRVFGNLMSLLTTMKSLPLAYNKDMQEDKEVVFDSLDTVKACLTVANEMLASITIKKQNMIQSLKYGHIIATDIADYLVTKGLPFRDAYKIVGGMVAFAIEKNKSLDDFSLEEFKNFSQKFEQDIFENISIENCVKKRKTLGGPSPESCKAHINFLDKFISQERKNF